MKLNNGADNQILSLCEIGIINFILQFIIYTAITITKVVSFESRIAVSVVIISDDTAPTGRMMYMNYKGEMVLATEELIRKLEEEDATWHWTPWLRTRTKVHNNELMEIDCISQDSNDSFPDSIFTGQFGFFLV